MKKDKQKVIDAVWTEEHIRSFLDLQPVEGLDPDFHTLLQAYHSMRADAFEQFIGMFCTAQRNLNAVGPDGETVLQITQQHRHGIPYASILSKAGAGS